MSPDEYAMSDRGLREFLAAGSGDGSELDEPSGSAWYCIYRVRCDHNSFMLAIEGKWPRNIDEAMPLLRDAAMRAYGPKPIRSWDGVEFLGSVLAAFPAPNKQLSQPHEIQSGAPKED